MSGAPTPFPDASSSTPPAIPSVPPNPAVPHDLARAIRPAPPLPAAWPRPGGRVRTAVVTSTPSDSHTWGLVVLQCVLEEAGYAVRNLGACTPVARVLDECRAARPDLLAVSTVNGHGRVEGAELVTALRGDPDLAGLPAVIGGMLTTGRSDPGEVRAELTALGYTGVYVGGSALAEFRSFLALPEPARTPADAHVR